MQRANILPQIRHLTEPVKLFNRVLNHLDKRIDDFGAQMVTFGVFGLINYPMFYIFWLRLEPHDYANIYMRLVAIILCFFLVLKDHWPASLKRYQSLYWYLTLLYCLPFFVTFMLMKNFTSSSWLTNVMLAMFILILLVDWLSALVLLIVGFAAGIVAYHFTENAHFYPLRDYVGPFSNYLCAFLIGVIFSRNNEILKNIKLNAMFSICSRVAHELRTPLLAIKSSANGGKRYLPALTETYSIAKKAQLSIPEIREDKFRVLAKIMDEIADEVYYSNTIIDMMLMSIQNKRSNHSLPFSLYSIKECVNEAFRRYPFANLQEQQRVTVALVENFAFYGSKILFVHILFNLIKNALYFVKQKGSGNVQIWTETSKRSNNLHIRDNGPGIAEDKLSTIFELFYTTTPNGTGLGLSFCKTVMENFGGNISCKSVLGEYTEFILSFPTVSKSE